MDATMTKVISTREMGDLWCCLALVMIRALFYGWKIGNLWGPLLKVWGECGTIWETPSSQGCFHYQQWTMEMAQAKK